MLTWGSEYTATMSGAGAQFWRHHQPTDAEILSRQESELAVNIRKATSIEEVSPKRTSTALIRHKRS
jgi:hypothetical protein